MELAEVASVHSTRYEIPRYQHKYRKGGKYGGISRKESHTPRARYIYVSGYKHALLFSMNLNRKVKGNNMSCLCDINIVSSIKNGIFEVSHNEIKTTCVVFYRDLYKTYILNGAYAIPIDLLYDIFVLI